MFSPQSYGQIFRAVRTNSPNRNYKSLQSYVQIPSIITINSLNRKHEFSAKNTHSKSIIPLYISGIFTNIAVRD
jgi:hypothetical protein